MAEPQACPECLRRSWLLGQLGPDIERMFSDHADAASLAIFALSNDSLVAAVAPNEGEGILEDLMAVPEWAFAARLAEAKCWGCCRHDDLYPDSLREATDAPWALIGLGDHGLLAELELHGTVAVVGASRATSYGREVARTLGRTLGEAGLVVISSLDFGIDGCAHQGALEAGRTIAVLGCGADFAYPKKNRSLWRRIAEKDLILSELPPGARPWRWTSPARNRIIAELTGMTVVVEAAARSRSLITADIAADLGRELGAVPGPTKSEASAGPNNLLAGGACVVRDAQDVLDALLGPRSEGNCSGLAHGSGADPA